MGLPKISAPYYKHHLKGIDKTIHYRGFTVREQKILLHAKQEESKEQEIEAIKQIVNFCTDGEVHVEDLPFFDIEDLFLRIRSKSVGEQIDVYFKDYTAENKTIKVTIDLNKIEVTFPEGHDKIIMLDDSLGMKMKYPSFDSISKEMDDFEMIKECIDVVFQGDEVFVFADNTEKDKNGFVDDFDSNVLLKIKDFFKTMPRIRYEQDVTLSDGNVEKIELEGIKDFFQ